MVEQLGEGGGERSDCSEASSAKFVKKKLGQKQKRQSVKFHLCIRETRRETDEKTCALASLMSSSAQQQVGCLGN